MRLDHLLSKELRRFFNEAFLEVDIRSSRSEVFDPPTGCARIGGGFLKKTTSPSFFLLSFTFSSPVEDQGQKNGFATARLRLFLNRTIFLVRYKHL